MSEKKLHPTVKVENNIVSSLIEPTDDETKSIPALILESIAKNPTKVYVVSE